MKFKILCKGDFIHGSDVFSLLSRGKQCVSICFIFLLNTIILDVHGWIKKDLHDVMKHGDELYRKIQNSLSPNSYDFLHPSELPEKMQFEENNFLYELQVKLLQTYSGVLCEDFVGICHCFHLKMLYSVLIVTVD